MSMIYTLSEYQIGYLQSLFIQCDFPEPHGVEVHNIGLIEDGCMVVSYIEYGQIQTVKIPRNKPESELPTNAW